MRRSDSIILRAAQTLVELPEERAGKTNKRDKTEAIMNRPQPILEALVKRDEGEERDITREEKARKVLTWRAGVGEGNGEGMGGTEWARFSRI